MENRNRSYNRRVLEEIGIGSLVIEQVLKEMDKKQPMFTKNIYTKVDEGILNRKLNFSQYEEGSENYRFNYYHTALVNKDTGFMKETLVYINKSNNLRQDELIKLLKGEQLSVISAERTVSTTVGRLLIRKRTSMATRFSVRTTKISGMI
ncbi:hypothetical protein WJU16_20980 [Chitinophaga pollutisoli]|uniref:Uncharacterized protein n=1 Tax=Chitinophaga pollutisoli TaxID=3133966 RepID=A0ABZ2YLT4_9BACT